jgi:hypothetical protein
LTLNKYSEWYLNVFSALLCFIPVTDTRLESFVDLIDTDSSSGVWSYTSSDDVCWLNSVSTWNWKCKCKAWYEWKDESNTSNVDCKLTYVNADKTINLSSTTECSTQCLHAKKLAEMWIITYRANYSDYKTQSLISRQELIAIALKIKWIEIPDNYACKNKFLDVSSSRPNNWACWVAELAMDNWIISKGNKYFQPTKNVSISEAYAIIFDSLDRYYRGSIINLNYNFYPDTQNWQKELIVYAFENSIIKDYSIDPNKPVARWELFSSILYLINIKNG